MTKPLLSLLLTFFAFVYLQAQESQTITIGTRHSLHSDILKEDREYWVSLPDSYDHTSASHKTYPLLVLLDGNVHFRALTGMVNYMSSDSYRSRQIPEMIVVGIQNVDRRRDYTPDKIVTVRENNSGGGEAFLSFLEKELIPQLEATYRTSGYRMLFGHSLGGLLAAHTYLKKETLFHAFLAIDPSFGTWDSETMDAKLDTLTDASWNRYLYVATANWGKRNIRNRDRHVRFFESLNSRCPKSFPGELEYFEHENHSSVPPIAFYNGMLSIFEGYGLSYREVENKSQLVGHYEQLSHRLSWEMKPPESLVNQVGYQLLRSKNEKDQEEALALFILNTENNPGSSNAFDSLGEAYERVGDTKKAIENYQKSLDLNPANENARNQIEALKSSR